MTVINKRPILPERQLANVEIRREIEERGLRYYEVAEKLGIHNTYLSVILRKELSPEKRKDVLRAINEAAASRQVIV